MFIHATWVLVNLKNCWWKKVNWNFNTGRENDKVFNTFFN